MTEPTPHPRDVGKINLQPHVPALDARHLNWLIARHLEACRIRLENQLTVDHYADELQWFVDWWEAEGPARQWLLRPDDFILFERHLRAVISPRTNRTLKYHTRHSIIKRLKESLRWAHELGYVDRNYAKWVATAKGAPPKRRVATITALQKLMDVVGAGVYPLRDRAIVAMLMGMGLRRQELSDLDIEDVVIHADCSGHAAVVGKRTKANETGQRDAAFDAATGRILVEYLDDCGRDSGPLFLGKRGGRLSGHGMYIMIKKALKRAKLDGHIVGPHDLRRAFATYYRRNRKNSGDLLQLQLGHANYDQTTEYTLLDVEDIRADLVSPLSLWDGL